MNADGSNFAAAGAYISPVAIFAVGAQLATVALVPLVAVPVGPLAQVGVQLTTDALFALVPLVAVAVALIALLAVAVVLLAIHAANPRFAVSAVLAYAQSRQ